MPEGGELTRSEFVKQRHQARVSKVANLEQELVHAGTNPDKANQFAKAQVISEVKQDIFKKRAERQEQRAKVAEKRSLHDSLTSLRNRRWLLGGENGDEEAIEKGELQTILDRAERHGKQVSVLFVDIDDFKPHNNTTEGDAGGDQDLIAVARILTNSTRSSDVAARLGGDEFVVVCEGAAGEDATGIAELIVENVEEESTKPTGSEFNMPTTVSIGYVTYPNREGLNSPKELIGAANAAQKLAKERGKSTVAPWFKGINSPK